MLGRRRHGSTDLLPERFVPWLCESAADEAWYAAASADIVTELAKPFGWSWSVEMTRGRLEEAAGKHPTGCVTVAGVDEKIDKDQLGVSNTKRVRGVSLFRPGVLERWNLGPVQLHEINPRLIVLRVTGFGQSGPYAARRAFGTLAEAMSWFAHQTGTRRAADAAAVRPRRRGRRDHRRVRGDGRPLPPRH